MNFTASFTCDSVRSTSWAQLLELWQAGDEIEIFEGAWTSDHLYPWQGGSGPCFEGWSALTALLCQTRRLRGGVLVTSVPYRPPGILAKMIATLDIASGGRLDIGLGAGWHEAECLAYGITLGDPSVRMARLEETVVALLSLMTNEETTLRGRYVRLEQAMCEPKPKQSPHPPICIGGGGERRMLPLVARYAQHWNLAYGSPRTFHRKRLVLTECCEAEGRPISDIRCSGQVWWNPGDPAGFVDQAGQFLACGADHLVVALKEPYSPSDLEQVASVLAVL